MIVDGPSPFILFRDPPGIAAQEPPTAPSERTSPQYFRAREAAEKAAAKAAASPEASRRHLELARAYAGLASGAKHAGRQ